MARKHYTEEKIAHCLATLRSNGGNLKRTSQAVGVSRQTLKTWSMGKLPMAVDRERVEEKTDQMGQRLVEQFGEIATLSLEEAKKKIPAASYRDLLIGAGISTEKRELLTGRPTSRQEAIKIALVMPEGLRTLAAQVASGMKALPPTVEGQYTEVPEPDIDAQPVA